MARRGARDSDGQAVRLYEHPETVQRRRAEHLAELEAAKAPCAWCGGEWSGVLVKHPGCAEALAKAAEDDRLERVLDDVPHVVIEP